MMDDPQRGQPWETSDKIPLNGSEILGGGFDTNPLHAPFSRLPSNAIGHSSHKQASVLPRQSSTDFGGVFNVFTFLRNLNAKPPGPYTWWLRKRISCALQPQRDFNYHILKGLTLPDTLRNIACVCVCAGVCGVSICDV